ncbi:putative signal peptide protein [Puccinia sorghi]|uniref:Putative signal peptide protein n=1 Tax=Puccinia sorghi TaxID=27349 RepID=A0A0L6VU01_9BASI|nr:putative signal peptide protein [Puccinia sorghi]
MLWILVICLINNDDLVGIVGIGIRNKYVCTRIFAPWVMFPGAPVSDHPYRVVQSRWLEYLRKESGQNFQGSRIAGFRIFKVNRMKMKIFSLQVRNDKLLLILKKNRINIVCPLRVSKHDYNGSKTFNTLTQYCLLLDSRLRVTYISMSSSTNPTASCSCFSSLLSGISCTMHVALFMISGIDCTSRAGSYHPSQLFYHICFHRPLLFPGFDSSLPLFIAPRIVHQELLPLVITGPCFLIWASSGLFLPYNHSPSFLIIILLCLLPCCISYSSLLELPCILLTTPIQMGHSLCLPSHSHFFPAWKPARFTIFEKCLIQLTLPLEGRLSQFQIHDKSQFLLLGTMQQKLAQLPAVDMQHAPAKLSCKLHLFVYVVVLAHQCAVCTVTVHQSFMMAKHFEKENGLILISKLPS